MATKVQVECFLKELHEKLKIGQIFFVHRQKNIEIYIKIQLVGLNTICISFHESEYHPMVYPFKERES